MGDLNWVNYKTLSALLLGGSLTTLKIFFYTLLFSLPLGLLVALCRRSRFWLVRKPAEIFILFMRGTPLMLQILFVYFAPYYIIGSSWGGRRLLAAVVAMALNYSAYFAEIYRGGIESVPFGQHEAGKVLGLGKTQTFFIVIFPQVVKRILPALSNEVITLVKDTALVQIIGVSELLRNAKEQASSLVSIVPFIVAAVFYLVINSVVTRFFHGAEKKLGYYK